ncbi:sulfotransferase [Alphaproteobacteria bacterium]|nr:sulfotransferase [Alphaproteobacteria bacterium]
MTITIEQAVAAHNFGNIQEAERIYQAILKQQPKHPDANHNLGLIAISANQIDAALPLFKTALDANPSVEQFWSSYIDALIKANKPRDAKKAVKNAKKRGFNAKKLRRLSSQSKLITISKAPSQEQISNLLEHYQAGRMSEAEELAISIRQDFPHHHFAWKVLGAIFAQTDRKSEAVDANQAAVSIAPQDPEAHSNLGNTLRELGRLDEAEASYAKAISLKPDYPEAYFNLGITLKDQGKFEDAIASYEKALSLKPGQPEMYNKLGAALQDQGKFDKAIETYNRALAIKPDHAEAHRNLSFLIEYEPNHPQIASVYEMMKRFDLTNDDRCNLHYAFAKMNEDIGKLDVAFENYVAGGRLRQKLLAYDFKQDELAFHQIKTAASKVKDTLFNKPVEASPHTPIFILGMPRSGTTLVEQIISSHSQVHGAGELSCFGSLATPLNLGNRIINPDSIFQVRDAYLNALGKVSNGSPLVTDKTPNNFLHIGLILKAIPEAKIIHVKRDPAATCWSNFKHYFSSNRLGYSYDLKDTVGYFKLYQDLMSFWRQEQGDQIYYLDYEKLTVEQEPETRKLIEHLQLGWEDACLSPQENKRSVGTASQQQVRKKVYTGSSGAWRKFEPYLQGAFNQLET